MTTRILIVDDEPEMVDTCVRILPPRGHRCDTATGARRALELLETCRRERARALEMARTNRASRCWLM
jgi:CheY-like chemotaxis protein